MSSLNQIFRELLNKQERQVPPLSTEEMQLVGEAFSEALALAMSRVSKIENRAIIVGFSEMIIQTVEPMTMFTSGMLSELRDRVYRDPVVKSFIDDLALIFYTYWGESGEKNINLSYNLTVAYTFDNSNSYSLVPKNISERSNSIIDTYQTLCANKWLVVIALLKVYGNIGKENKKS